jgi:hypothetical protein
VIID